MIFTLKMKTLELVGPAGAGKKNPCWATALSSISPLTSHYARFILSLLLGLAYAPRVHAYTQIKLNGVSLESLEALETKGKARYDQILPTLRDRQKTTSFYTPSFEVTIVDPQPDSKPTDSIALVLSPDTINDDFSVPVGKLTNRPVVDSIQWSDEAFLDFKQTALKKLESLGIKMDQFGFTPVSGLTGENVVVTPEKWLGTILDGEIPTLVTCLDRTLRSESKDNS
ncbi:hypothetical protein CLCR_11412 [Cladophialophora carrionii]|uniref:Uncharacterized protein n=1 Tax=Cladophialophora carrionii TaxID=86049 RepID=A0A1C1CXB9_9EURO|nr:hypothetical protein CLCR_11412 [Cladophialophora carrionii]